MFRLIVALLLVLILIVFGLSNREIVSLGFWPTGYSLTLPLSIAMLVAMAIAFLLGGIIVWLDHLGLGRRARRAEAQVARLQAELTQAEARRMPIPPAPRPVSSAPMSAAPAGTVPDSASLLPPARG